MKGKPEPQQTQPSPDPQPEPEQKVEDLQVIAEWLQEIGKRLYRIEDMMRPPEPIAPSTGMFSRVVRRSYSEAEMHKAISNIVASKKYPDDDDPIEILIDAINELLVLRDVKERIAQQTLQWQTELNRR
jgi:hypothetical protein